MEKSTKNYYQSMTDTCRYVPDHFMIKRTMVRYNMRTIILFLTFLLAPSFVSAVQVTLPYQNNFTSSSEFSAATGTWGSNEAQTWYHDQSGGYGDNGSCVRSQIHTNGGNVQGGLGEFHWASEDDEANHTSRTNVGFLFWPGSGYTQAMRSGGQKVLLFLDGEGARPKLFQREYYSDFTAFAPCQNAGGNCTFMAGGDNPTPADTFHIEDYEEQWVWIEFEIIQNTSIKLYIYTQDGAFNGLYINNTAHGARATSQYALQHLFAYFTSGAVSGASSAYFKVDNLNIAESFIGPPNGFINGSDINTYSLTLTKIENDGSGTVISSPGDINCGSTCFDTFNENSIVTLSATGDDVSWSGDCDANGAVNIGTSDKACTATFTGTSPPTDTTPSNNGLPWTADFETGNLGEFNASITPLLSVSTTAPQSGLYAARAPLTAGTHSDNYADHLFGDFYNVGLDKVEELNLELYSKFDPGYVWPSDSHKIAVFNLTDGNVSARRYQVMIMVNSRGEYLVDHTYMDTWQFFGLTQNRNGSVVTVREGQWDKLRMYVKLNDPDISNGIVRLWINDLLKVEYTDVNIRENTDFGMNKLIMSSYATDSSGSNGVQWYDNWSLSTPDTEVIPSLDVPAGFILN